MGAYKGRGVYRFALTTVEGAASGRECYKSCGARDSPYRGIDPAGSVTCNHRFSSRNEMSSTVYVMPCLDVLLIGLVIIYQKHGNEATHKNV